ncbi:MAG: PulJ/GspJ family protein [Planctomycetota bacterium]|jgi:type II secretion system protein J
MLSKKTGFTLVEVLVASTIGVFIAMVAVGALRAIIASAEKVDSNINAAAEVRFAANMISRDLRNFYNNDDIENTKFIGTLEALEENNYTSYLIFYTLSRTKARVDHPEGDLYEVEYYLAQEGETSLLMRRFWPNPSKEYEYIEPGGILTVIAEDIGTFEVQYFDGEEWFEEWPEEMQALPELVSVSIVAKQPNHSNPPSESIIVNLTRSKSEDVSILQDGGTTTAAPDSSG